MAIKRTHQWLSRLVNTPWTISPLLVFGIVSSFAANSQTANDKAIHSLPGIYCVVMLCDSGPKLLQPQAASLRLQVSAPMRVFSFTNTGSSINSCNVTPVLPVGLTVDAMNCDVSGTPMVVGPAALYTITATSNLGESSVELTIEVVTIENSRPNLVNPTPSNITRNVGSPISPITITNTGGPISSCTISPSLPLGVSIASSDCTISGLAFAATPTSAYTITAVNVNGTSAIDITLEIVGESG